MSEFTEEFRAYDKVTEWSGPIRTDVDAAWKDAPTTG